MFTAIVFYIRTFFEKLCCYEIRVDTALGAALGVKRLHTAFFPPKKTTKNFSKQHNFSKKSANLENDTSKHLFASRALF